MIKGVDLSVSHGEFVVFVGPSGCGKSTLLRMIAGLEEATAGDIIIDERKVDKLAPVERGIAMVFQSYALYPHMSVFENIAFPLRVMKLPEAEVKKKVGHAAAILQLEERLQHRPGQLSGGQRQRVAIGRAIVREPSVFLFDEPLSNLDAALRADMRVELAKLHHDLDATMIYVTHDQVEAMTMADRIVVLNAGEIAQVGSPIELYHKPADTFVAGFIGNPRMNFFDVTCTAASASDVTVELTGAGTATVPVAPRGDMVGKKLTLGVRPEQVVLEHGDFNFTVVPSVVERLGIHTVAYATIGARAQNFCCVLPGNVPVVTDKPFAIGIRAVDCHLFDADGKALERQVELTAFDPTLLEAAASA